MVETVKKRLFFTVSWYFRLLAGIRLKRWNPTIIVITGSNGKTTLLHLLEAQIGKRARYSHHANSAIGVPFDVLGIRRETLRINEWLKIFVSAPLCAVTAPPQEKFYIIEADCDRPYEGKFLASFLRPDIVLWLNSARTHSMNFDHLSNTDKFPAVEDAIAYEFGFFVKYAKELVIVNADQPQIVNQLPRTKAKVIKITKKDYLKSYSVNEKGTSFQIKKCKIFLPHLLPKETFYGLVQTIELLNYLKFDIDLTFSKFKLPPGRNSCFSGIKNTSIVDSSYNANLSSMNTVLDMFNMLADKPKWMVLGGMLEQGRLEKEEHIGLANKLLKVKADKIILMGLRTKKYVYPVLKAKLSKHTDLEYFNEPKEILNYIKKSITGGETILFKGGRLLEGIIENLLKNKADTKYLCRREAVWQERRKKAGL